MNQTPKAAVIMGSDSDFPVVKKCIDMLKKFGIHSDVNVISAHRTPDLAAEYAKNAQKNGIDIIIAAAGKAAHLAGVLAAYTTLPVIGIPMKSSTLDGLDSLLSVVQMPKGIPVATVAVDGAENAGILAAQILALKYDTISPLLSAYKEEMAKEVAEKSKKLRSELEI